MNVYIIRLLGNELSERLASDAFNAALNFNFDPIYFNAIHKDNVLEFIERYKIKYAKDKKILSSLGTLGCFASHYSLWVKISRDKNPSVIVEHDGIIIRDFKHIIKDVNDVCHLDPHNPYSTTYFEDVQKDQSIFVEDYKRAKEKKKLITGGYFRGAYGYILTPTGAQKLIRFVKENGCFTADRTICENALILNQTSVTCVRLHDFFDSSEKIKDYSTRK